METKTGRRIVSKRGFRLRLTVAVLGEQIMNPLPNEEVFSQPQKAEKRLVSRSEYVRLFCRKIAFCLGGYGAGLVATACAVGTVLVYRYLMVKNNLPGWGLGAALLSGSGACFLFVLAGKWLQTASEELDAVLLTDEVAASVPLPDSLVRASSEPLQAQENVLLRPAAKSVEKHEEQLVRASAGLE